MIYLASPYSHPDKYVVEARVLATAAFVAYHLQAGVHLISTIVHNHELAKHHKLPTDAKFWESYNEDLIRSCSGVWVLKLDGWAWSKGVAAEEIYAARLGIPIEYKEPL